MSAAENKQRMREIFAQLAQGSGRLLVDTMAEDFCWHVTGTTAWSRTYRGKGVVREELLAPLLAQFADRYTNEAQRLIAEDDFVVVECRGHVTTTAGRPYHNVYCWVCRFADGQLAELTEYMDTELVATALRPPAPR